MKKLITIALASLFICFSAKAQIVSIPDAKFKTALFALGVDKNNDGQIQESEALLVNILNIGSQDIESLEGISAFKNLTELRCLFNKLHSLDLSKNIELKYLICSYNQLRTLDVSHNNLTLLNCEGNLITELDLSSIEDLSNLTLDCTNNLVTKIYLRAGSTPVNGWAKDPTAEYVTKPGTNVVNTTITNKEDKPDSTSDSKKLVDALKDLFKDDNEKKEDESKCVSGNCINGFGTLTFTGADGPATYKGSFKNGKFNGQGSLVVKDSYKYTGSFKDGSIDGKGTYTYSTGEVYTGEIKNGIIEGNGTMIYKNGKKSTGIWKENKFWSGTGYLIYDDNSSYYGGVKENMPDGKGVRSFTNGKNFTGTFSKGEPMNGKGYFFFTKDNTSYEGTLTNGKFSGMGIYSDDKGAKLTGNFINGLLTGAGKYTRADGVQYDGNFKDGNLDGYGVMKYKTGEVYKGNFTNNKEDGQGDLYDVNGNLDYSGNWSNGQMTNPENSASYKKNRLDEAKQIFSRIYFKGQRELNQYGLKGKVVITDEYYLNNDYTVTGTHEEVINIGGTIYKTKSKIKGSYDPVSHTIYMNEGSIIYRDKFPEGTTWRIPGTLTFDGKIYIHKSHPGYYLIEGKDDQGNKFVETDYQ